jgi:4-hydroxyphenylpyruvate dioxygenase
MPGTSVDHVAQALPAGRMDNFVLFYHAVFGFSPDQLWEIPDSYGLVRSRTMVSADRSVRLPLNVSESRETATGRFLRTYAGAGVQHIALATDDILHALEQAFARGARILGIPANYCEDIGANWGLSAEPLESLRQHNLLYDQDENGEFLHAYTDPFDGRFFFEFVQRLGGYHQYGAANAAVRMAAQAQQRVSG